MLKPFWKNLKSGTDIRGIAVEGANGEPVNLTDDVVDKISAGFAAWLIKKTKKHASELTVSVGRDSRLSGPRIKDAVINALTGAGINVIDCGLASTPAMLMSTMDLNCDGAVQITASHHPFNRNGLKFFTPEGGLEGGDITDILYIAQGLSEGGKRFKAAVLGSLSRQDYMSEYAKRLREMICAGVNSKDYDRPLEGFHIVVDAGNGVGGFYAEKVLAPLGADIKGSQFLEPDGRFPNHIPNPEDKQAMESIRIATVRAGADLGIIFDTDVDRAGVWIQPAGDKPQPAGGARVGNRA